MKTGSVSNVLEPAAVNGYPVKGIPKVSVFFAMEASNSRLSLRAMRSTASSGSKMPRSVVDSAMEVSDGRLMR